MAEKEKPYILRNIALGVGALGLMVGEMIWGEHGENVRLKNTIKEGANILQKKGLLGEIPIIDLREVPGFDFKGHMAAGFLVVSGEFQGKTTEMLEFALNPGGEKGIQTSRVPTRNVQYLIMEDPNTKPTVRFTGMKPESFIIYGAKPGAGCMVGREPIAINSNNVNDYVDAVADQIAIVTISRKDWGEFRGVRGK